MVPRQVEIENEIEELLESLNEEILQLRIFK
jgi:hypothetical protein